MTGAFIERGNLETCTHRRSLPSEETQREDDHLQAKDRGLELILPPQPSERTKLADFLPPEQCETINFCCLSNPVCGSLLWQL